MFLIEGFISSFDFSGFPAISEWFDVFVFCVSQVFIGPIAVDLFDLSSSRSSRQSVLDLQFMLFVVS